MTVKELKEALEKLPDHVTVVHAHHKNGAIVVKNVSLCDHTTPAGKHFQTVLLEGER